MILWLFVEIQFYGQTLARQKVQNPKRSAQRFVLYDRPSIYLLYDQWSNRATCLPIKVLKPPLILVRKPDLACSYESFLKTSSTCELSARVIKFHSWKSHSLPTINEEKDNHETLIGQSASWSYPAVLWLVIKPRATVLTACCVSNYEVRAICIFHLEIIFFLSRVVSP